MTSKSSPHRLLDMHEIRPRLYLGSMRSAADRCALAELGITHVLSVCLAAGDLGHRQRVRLQPSAEDPCTRLVIAVQDVASARLDRHFDACSAFISEGLANGAVLVHCQAGQSRSPTVVIAHLMRQERWTVDAALQFVQARRASVQPNIGFMDQLKALESRLGLQKSTDIDDSEDRLASDFAGVDLSADEKRRNEKHAGNTEESTSAEVLSTVDVKVEVPDLFGAAETRLRCERFRSRCHRVGTVAGLLGVAAPLRKRRYQI